MLEEKCVSSTFYKTKKQLPTSKIKLSIENNFKILKYHRTFEVDMSIAPCLQCIKIEGTQDVFFIQNLLSHRYNSFLFKKSNVTYVLSSFFLLIFFFQKKTLGRLGIHKNIHSYIFMDKLKIKPA